MKNSSLLFLVIICALQADFLSAQLHQNHTGQLTINGKNSHSYTVQFSEQGDTVRRITSYLDAAQKLVRMEITKFQTKPLSLISNKIDDYRTGEYLAQEMHGNRFTTRRRERQGEEIKEKSVTAENAIVATLVSEKARQNVELLDKGQEVSFTLALPALGIVTEMKFVKTGSRTVNGISCVTVKTEPTNIFLKAAMGEASYFSFERAAPHRFMHYEGVLGLPNDEGKQQSGSVVMKY